jgi:hypothetical protein
MIKKLVKRLGVDHSKAFHIIKLFPIFTSKNATNKKIFTIINQNDAIVQENKSIAIYVSITEKNLI